MKAASILDLKPLIIISLRYLNPTNYKKLLHTHVFLQKVRKKKYFYKIIKKKLSSRIRELEQEDNVWHVPPHYLV